MNPELGSPGRMASAIPMSPGAEKLRSRDSTRSPSPSMPWLSRTPSFQSQTTSPLASPSPSLRSSSPRMQCAAKPQCPAVTYTPPLIDGACGTVPLAQKPASVLFLDELKEMWAALPQLLAALRGTLSRRPGGKALWSQTYDMAIHACLVVMELAILIALVPLWLVLPGIGFVIWLGLSAMFVLGLSWSLNGNKTVVSCDGATSRLMENQTDRERWVFVSGFGTSISQLKYYTLPLLARVLTRRIIGIHVPSYGVPFDLLLLLLHRAVPSLQSKASRALYYELRTALLEDGLTRVAVMCHSTGSVPLASVLVRLSADIQPEKLSKLEIFTFGASTCEFAVPLGGTKKLSSSMTGSPRHEDASTDYRGPHIEHFAFANDPFARMGVLRAIYRDLERRFCGGVFILNPLFPTQSQSQSSPQSRSRSSQPFTFRMIDYLTALFPSEVPTRDASLGGSSVLDHILSIDRETAEKRELVAMASYAKAKQSRQESRRTSWTGLGATVGRDMNDGVMGGVVGLEMARKGCKRCDGRTGWEVSRLAAHVQRETGLGLSHQERSHDALGLRRVTSR